MLIDLTREAPIKFIATVIPSTTSCSSSSPLTLVCPPPQVREKTGRSIPLSRASLSGPPMASGEQFGSQEGFRLRKGSTPLRSSQGGSRPPSRAGSEASLDSVDGGRPSYRHGSGTPAHSGRQRKVRVARRYCQWNGGERVVVFCGRLVLIVVDSADCLLVDRCQGRMCVSVCVMCDDVMNV